MAELNKLKIWACYYYHQMGFNVTHIIPSENIKRDKDNFLKKNPFKSSTNNRENYDFIRQSNVDMETFDWHNAKGIGTVAGFNGLRALDFDGSTNTALLSTVLKILGLPENYEWVVTSGSNNGFHIIFYCGNFEFAGYKSRLKRYFPNKKHKPYFKCIDFIWFNHLILPPSLHKTGNNYKFLNVEYPFEKPLSVAGYNLRNMLFELCYEYGGFNIIKNEIELEKYYEIPIIDSAIIINKVEYDNYLMNKSVIEDDSTSSKNEILFYSNTAQTLDNVYKKETYKIGLDKLNELLKAEFTNKTIIEIAAGNGYWTKILSEFCKTVKATDINENCIEEAKRRVKSANVSFELKDCQDLQTAKKYDGLFGGFIISHICRNKLKEFFSSINGSVKKGGSVILFENRLVVNNKMEIHSHNDVGDTFQKRVTQTGEEYLIIKNFFEYDELRSLISQDAYDIEYTKLKYFWALKYKVR